jgi:hypothetical protein
MGRKKRKGVRGCGRIFPRIGQDLRSHAAGSVLRSDVQEPPDAGLEAGGGCFFPMPPKTPKNRPAAQARKPRTSPQLKSKAGPARDRRVWLERRAFELSKFCPKGHSNPASCPLCGLRPRPARERRAWLHQLTDDELEYLASYHKTCYAMKSVAPRR